MFISLIIFLLVVFLMSFILFQILCGDQSTINSLVDLMDTWYHLMVSTLLFTNPTIKLFRLHTAAQGAITTMGGEERITPLDHILLAVMESDAHEVIWRGFLFGEDWCKDNDFPLPMLVLHFL